MNRDTRRSVVRAVSMAAVLLAGTGSPARADLAPPLLQLPERIAGDAAATSRVAVLDFDGDGVPDIATVGPNRLQLIRGLPDGWAEPQHIGLPSDTSWADLELTTGDVTGDGDDDIVISIADAGKVLVVDGRDDGVLTSPPAADVYAVNDANDSFAPQEATSVALGDLDGDGSLDVVAAFTNGFSAEPSPIRVLVNDGDGRLSSAASVTAIDPVKVMLVPLGGDDDPDLVIAEGTVFAADVEGRIAVRPGGAGATFGEPTWTDITDGYTADLAGGDFNGDGAADVLVGLHSRSGAPGQSAKILSGDPGTPVLGAPTAVPSVPWDVGSAVDAGDLDRDGRDDVAVSYADPFGVEIMRNVSSQGFADASSGVYDFRYRLTDWVVGDADGDGKLDVIALAVEKDAGAPAIRIYYGTGPHMRPPGPWPANLDFGDVRLGARSAPLTATFDNDGPGTAQDLAVLTDGDVSSFEIDTGGCSGHTLDVGASCSMRVRFDPTTTGDAELDVAVVAPDTDEAFWLAFFGTGVVAAPAPPPTAAPATTVAPATPEAAAQLTRARAARVVGRGKSARLDTGWRAGCPGSGPVCRVDLVAVARARPGHTAPVIARGHLTVASGETTRIVARLTTAGRRALAHGRRVRTFLQLTASRAGTATVVMKRTVTLRH